MSMYFDYGAATPVDERVIAEMQPYLTQKFYNPSAIYLHSRAVKKDLNAAREVVAKELGTMPGNIVFTAGGTESDNLAIRGVMDKFSGSSLIVSAVEHDAVLAPAKRYDHKVAPVDQKGQINLQKLEELIDDKTVLVSIMYANNEVGTVMHIKDVAKIINAARKDRDNRGVDLPLYLHSDAAQATNYLDLSVDKLGVDLLSINSGKIYGPKMVGALYIRPRVQISAQILGGGQERSLRSGTENVAGIVGFAKALRIARGMRKDEAYRVAKLRDLLIKDIQEKIPQATINGSLKNRLPNNVNISLPGIDGERAVMMLDEAGIQCSTGSACTALTDEDSHVLKALGLDLDLIRASLRLTLGRQTNESDCKKAAVEIANMYKYFQD